MAKKEEVPIHEKYARFINKKGDYLYFVSILDSYGDDRVNEQFIKQAIKLKLISSSISNARTSIKSPDTKSPTSFYD